MKFDPNDFFDLEGLEQRRAEESRRVKRQAEYDFARDDESEHCDIAAHSGSIRERQSTQAEDR